VRRRAAGGLADAHADPRDREVAEAPREARGRGHHAPGGAAHGDDRAPDAPVGEARDRDAGEGVEHREGAAGQEAHRRVGDAELAADRLDQDREDLAVDEVEDVDDEQEPEDPARLGPPGRGRCRALLAGRHGAA
jgi:hypothetical protein